MKSTKKILRLLITGTTVFVLVTVAHILGVFSWIENKAYDGRMQATADLFHPSEEIGVVLLDQDSLDWAKESLEWGWPWPRSSYAKMIDFFRRGNAASIAFDMLYTEPSLYGPEDDETLGDACSRFGKVVQTVYYSSEGSAPLYPVDPIKEGAAILGSVTSSLDADGFARRNRFHATTGEPGLAVASLILGEDLPDLDAIPKAKGGGMYIRFQKSLDNYIPYTAQQILESEFAIEEAEANGTEVDFSGDLLDPAMFEGMHIFFGLYAAGLFDICTTPISAKYPGVGVHICQLDTILSETYLRDAPLWLVLLLIALTTLAGCLAGGISKQANTKSIIGQTLIFILLCAVYVAANFGAFIPGLILPLGAPIIALVISFFATVLETYLSEGKQKRYLKAAFKQYLSPAVIDNLIDNPDLLKLGGERREITAFFSDIQGFTSISENLTPEQMTSFLNTYLSEMSDIILAHGGTIDKYEGDAIIAFWNAPTFQDDHAKRGLEAALACQKKLQEMQGILMEITGRPVKQRIGLNTGIATVGNFGSKNRFDYTMMGDTVNLASRLEGINKQFGTYTMCSQATMEGALKNGCDLHFRPVADIAVVGRKEAVKVFNPMEQSEAASQKKAEEIFAQGYALFQKGDFQSAKATFETAGEDPVCKSYAAKCQKYIQNPPENWEGIIQATEK